MSEKEAHIQHFPEPARHTSVGREFISLGATTEKSLSVTLTSKMSLCVILLWCLQKYIQLSIFVLWFFMVFLVREALFLKTQEALKNNNNNPLFFKKTIPGKTGLCQSRKNERLRIPGPAGHWSQWHYSHNSLWGCWPRRQGKLGAVPVPFPTFSFCGTFWKNNPKIRSRAILFLGQPRYSRIMRKFLSSPFFRQDVQQSWVWGGKMLEDIVIYSFFKTTTTALPFTIRSPDMLQQFKIQCLKELKANYSQSPTPGM